MSDPHGIGELVYLYVGTDDVARDFDFYRDALGAELVWRFEAEHRDAPSCLPIWAVTDLDRAVERLEASGFDANGETAGTPDGPVHVFEDPSGNQIGLLRQDRPNALDAAFTDPDNPRAVR